MPKSGDIYRHGESTYVLLSTSLGWMAFDIATLTAFGVPRKNVRDAIDGLKPTGLKLNLKHSKMVDSDIPEDEDDEF